MKVAVLSSCASTLITFRLDMMLAMQKCEHTVIAIAPESDKVVSDRLCEMGIKYISVPISRNGINPVEDLKSLAGLCSVLRREKPDIIFAYQAKTIIYGCIAGRCVGISRIYALLAGLGSIFRAQSIREHIIKRFLCAEYKLALAFCHKVFFQNNDDRTEFVDARLVPSAKTVIINGSGVNLTRFTPKPFPEGNAFLFIGRLLHDKGIMEFLQAARNVKKQYPDTRFMVVGFIDTNPTAIKEHELTPFIEEGTIEYFGQRDDVRPYIEMSSVFVLPSYHEGTPKCVLESMAMGRPIITTDAPGCRETVVDGQNGFLVPVRNVEQLESKMVWFIGHRSETAAMGLESLRMCRDKYDVDIVNEHILKTLGLYMPIIPETPLVGKTCI